MQNSKFLLRFGWLIACAPALGLIAYAFSKTTTNLHMPMGNDGSDYLRISQDMYRYSDFFQDGLIQYIWNLYLTRSDHATLLHPHYTLLFFPLVGGNPMLAHSLASLLLYPLLGGRIYKVISHSHGPVRALLPTAALLSMPWIISKISTNESDLLFWYLLMGALAEIWHPNFGHDRRRSIYAGLWLGIGACDRPAEAIFCMILLASEIYIRRETLSYRARYIKEFFGIAFVIPLFWFGPALGEVYFWIYNSLFGAWHDQYMLNLTAEEKSFPHFARNLRIYFTEAVPLFLFFALFLGKWKKVFQEKKPVYWALLLLPLQILIAHHFHMTWERRFIYAVLLLLIIAFLLLESRCHWEIILCFGLIGFSIYAVVIGRYFVITKELCAELQPRLAQRGISASETNLVFSWFDVDVGDGYLMSPAACTILARSKKENWHFHFMNSPTNILVDDAGASDAIQNISYVLIGPFFDREKVRVISDRGDTMRIVRQKFQEHYVKNGDRAFPFAAPIDLGEENPVKFFLVNRQQMSGLRAFVQNAY